MMASCLVVVRTDRDKPGHELAAEIAKLDPAGTRGGREVGLGPRKRLNVAVG